MKEWLHFVAALLAAALATLPQAVDGMDSGEPRGSPRLVRIESGWVRGTDASQPDVVLFGSIPYAAPPIGNLRWRPPQPVRDWNGTIRQADRLPAECPQVRIVERSLFASAMDDQSEDCLYLNIWTAAPSSLERRPVMVWLHGGGFMQGSTAPRIYDGAALAKRGVVFVSVNYRLGVLGFLSHPELSEESVRHVSGNYGILDQIAALRWIRRNIGRFGGDPSNVTVIGQSAGSMSLSLLTSSPLATGLFHRGIGQTGAVAGMLTSHTLAEAEAKGTTFAQSLGAHSAEQLRRLDVDRLVAAAGAVPGTFEPVVDGWVVPANLVETYRALHQNDIALLIGSNSDENPLDPSVTLATYKAMAHVLFGARSEALLALFPAANDAEARISSQRLMTQTMAQYPVYVWAELQRRYGTSPVYLYRFTRNVPVPANRYVEQIGTSGLGAWHGAEIPYALDNLRARDWPWEPVDEHLAEAMTTYWINFARTGDPNGRIGSAGTCLPRWPDYRTASNKVMELGRRIGPMAEPSRATFEIMNEHYSLEPWPSPE